jgi:hypothetical protein
MNMVVVVVLLCSKITCFYHNVADMYLNPLLINNLEFEAFMMIPNMIDISGLLAFPFNSSVYSPTAKYEHLHCFLYFHSRPTSAFKEACVYL